MKKLPSLRIILMIVFLASWLIPIAVFSFFILYSYQNAYIEKTENVINNAVNVSGVMAATKINDAIELVQKPTYEGVWESYYTRYENGEMSREDFINEIKLSLRSKFYMDDRFSTYAFYMEGDDRASYYADKNKYSLSDYVNEVEPEVDEIRTKDSNYVELRIINNRLYIIRNLYTISRYRKYGTLVVAMDREDIFSEMPVEELAHVKLTLNDDDNFLQPDGAEVYNDDSNEAQYNEYIYNYYGDNYSLKLFYTIDRAQMYSGVATLNNLVLIILISMIPLIIATYIFLNKQIRSPLNRLLNASDRIKDGEFGTTIEHAKMPNKEFFELTSSINSMSEQVKHLFDTVYMQELATKDAQIAALQAQINPHFLNNTLEMMNWQARMNNDIETCKMIEALGTVLDSGMNRSNNKQVLLSQELRCGDAFLYIMSMRFGQRLKIEKEIDENLLRIYVPQLILQPILENAIKHGIEQVMQGTIWLKIYKSETIGEVCIDIINTGKGITDDELTRIHGILEGEGLQENMGPGRHTSIGIYNVNMRLRLIYGKNFGLSIMRLDEERVLSRITIPSEAAGIRA